MQLVGYTELYPVEYLDLYRNYIDVQNPKSDGFSAVRCPFHEDKSKSAGIDLHTGVFTCRGGCGSLSPYGFVSRFLGIADEKSRIIVDTFKSENGIKTTENNFDKKFVLVDESKKFRELYMKSKETPLKKTFAKEFAKLRGIPLELLEEFDIGFLNKEDVWITEDETEWRKGDALTFPYFYGGRLVGIRYRSEDGSKSSPKGSYMVPWGVDSITDLDTNVILTEGETDRLRMIYEVRKADIDCKVLGIPGSELIRKEWGRDFSGIENLVIVPDTDDPGQKLAKTLKDYFPNKVKVVHLPWKRGQLGKDFSEWIAQNNFDEISDQLTREFNQTSIYGALNTLEFLETKEDEEVSEAIISGLLYQGQIGVLGGPQKSGKTMVALNLVSCILTPGNPFLGIKELKSSENTTKILYVQTEGSREKFKNRINVIFKDCPYKEQVSWWFKPGIKLDTEEGYKRLEKMVETTNAGLVILDPFQRLHNRDEDSSTETAIVWENLFRLGLKFPKIAIIILHHFRKGATISERWEALRGSSRMGGEVDFGLFMEKRPAREGQGIRMIGEFRDEEPFENEDGSDIIKFHFDKKTLTYHKDVMSVSIDKRKDFVAETKKRGEWKLMEAVEFFGVSLPTINKWIELSDDLVKTPPSKSNPAMVVYRESNDG